MFLCCTGLTLRHLQNSPVGRAAFRMLVLAGSHEVVGVDTPVFFPITFTQKVICFSWASLAASAFLWVDVEDW